MKRLLYAVPALAVVMFSCKKNDTVITTPTHTAGVYVLTEGNFGYTDSSSIDYYDIATNTVTKDYFRTVNAKPIGTSANELKQYGGKMYCTLTGVDFTTASESVLEVIDVATCRSLKTISFANGSDAYMPRSVAFDKGKVYVTSYAGIISRIDTSTLAVEDTVQLHTAADGIAIANGKIYVANSQYYLSSSTDYSSLSVIDVATFTKTGEITVAANPVRVSAASNGYIYVGTWGVYPDYATHLTIVDSKTDAVVTDAATSSYINWFTLTSSTSYMLAGGIFTLNTNTGNATAFTTSGVTVSNPYAVNVDGLTSDVYVTNASYAGTDSVYAFSAAGALKYRFGTRNYPQSCVFIYK